MESGAFVDIGGEFGFDEGVEDLQQLRGDQRQPTGGAQIDTVVDHVERHGAIGVVRLGGVERTVLIDDRHPPLHHLHEIGVRQLLGMTQQLIDHLTEPIPIRRLPCARANSSAWATPMCPASRASPTPGTVFNNRALRRHGGDLCR